MIICQNKRNIIKQTLLDHCGRIERKSCSREIPYLSGVKPAAGSCCSVLKARAEKREGAADSCSTVESFVPFLQFITRRDTNVNIN